jgi:hypothetical protein
MPTPGRGPSWTTPDPSAQTWKACWSQQSLTTGIICRARAGRAAPLGADRRGVARMGAVGAAAGIGRANGFANNGLGPPRTQGD